MSWFYNKKISIYKYAETVDEYGISREGYSLIADSLMVDIQPYSTDKAKKDYGYEIETTKRIFMDIMPEVTESSVVKYKEQFYKIQKIIEWDDFVDVMLLETKDVAVNE